MTRIIAPFSILFLSATGAYAHMGHVGDLAGHAHWVGIAATVGAAALAALVAKAGKQKMSDAEEAAPEADGEEQPEGAST